MPVDDCAYAEEQIEYANEIGDGQRASIAGPDLKPDPDKDGSEEELSAAYGIPDNVEGLRDDRVDGQFVDGFM